MNRLTGKKNTVITKKIEEPVDSISEPLLKKMSSERTLAVQAALMLQPQKAVAMMVWRLCSCVFDYGGMSASHPFDMKVTEHHTSLVSESPAGKTGKAWQTLMQEKARLQALLPEGWSEGFHHVFHPRRGNPDVPDGVLYRQFSVWRADPNNGAYHP
ncbi:Uncharacterised protein [Raoultella terrigena]|uniref:Uncharacterized protein n=1 Tax=Raoultella terrigena TaxID=577 RepID=A0A3P8KGD3_RAOTE|nr:Uncharacterised protein [Raoultella terrigena]